MKYRNRFLPISISLGHSKLLIDGRTASRPGQGYGVFEVGIDVRAGHTHILPYTIWMPEIDIENAVSIPSPTPDEIVVTTPHIDDEAAEADCKSNKESKPKRITNTH